RDHSPVVHNRPTCPHVDLACPNRTPNPIDWQGGTPPGTGGGWVPDVVRACACSCFHSRVSGMSTWRERSHSPRDLACGSKRVDAATPWPSRPCSTKLIGLR